MDRLFVKSIPLVILVVVLTSVESQVTPEDTKSWKVKITPSAQKVAEGSVVVFTCESSLSTEVKFEWMKPIRPIKDKDSIEIVQIAHNRSVLRIEQAHVKKHRRTFRCKAFYEDPKTNTVIDRSATAVLKIVSTAKLPKNFPKVTSEVTDQIATRPGKIPLLCEIEGAWSKYPPIFTWIKDSLIDLSLEKDNWENDGMRILYIDPRKDVGEYQCVAFHKKGSVGSYGNTIGATEIARYIKDEPTTTRRPNNTCTNYNGDLVMDGELFRPGQDPCESCMCSRGRTALCDIAVCEAPPCSNYILIPDTCCGFECLDCFSYDGAIVSEGESYQPESDPCKTCVCEKGQPSRCFMVSCMKPQMPCADPLPIPGECCKFTCDRLPDLFDVTLENRKDCIAYNGSRVHEGQMYNPDSDPCKICTCQNGHPDYCIEVACYLPPMSCEKPIPIPGKCCEKTCNASIDGIAIKTRDCIAYNGSRVREGQMYNPDSDPCKTCTCQNGHPDYCMMVACYPPPMSCEKPIPIPEKCCEYTCNASIDGIAIKTRDCIAYNGSSVREGQMYNPDSDPCKTCTCQNGHPDYCIEVACYPPQMPCEKPISIPGKCCEYTCNASIDGIAIKTRDCIAYNGSRVREGQKYNPDSDPCKTCTCQNGHPDYCIDVACYPPPMPCEKPISIPGKCCQYTCNASIDELAMDRGGCMSYNGTMVQYGMKYQPSEDPCRVCLCSRTDSVCVVARCAPPPMSCQNPQRVPNQCCSFTCNRTFELDDISRPRLNDGYDRVLIRPVVQQVGARDVMIQWKVPDMGMQMDVRKVELIVWSRGYYNKFEVENGTNQIMLQLNQSQTYNLTMLAVGRWRNPDDRQAQPQLNPTHFSLEPKATASLNLYHATGTVYESRGSYGDGIFNFPRPFEPLMLDNKFQKVMNLNSFNLVEISTYPEMPCRKLECGLLRFYMYNITGHPQNVMSLMFEEDMDFQWAKAHL